MTQFVPLFSMLVLLLFTAATCDEGIPSTPVERLTKAKREQLGDLLRDQILQDTTVQIWPDSGKATKAYLYLGGLYQQVTNEMRLDLQSPSNNRWNDQRVWQLYIEQYAEPRLFTLPGGHLFVSTGLLKRLEREYEIYGLFALDAQLVNEDFLINKLISDYGTQTLLNLVEENLAANALTLEIIARELPNLNFDPLDIADTDPAALELICRSSLYDPTGILAVTNHLDENSPYFQTRPSYGDRSNFMENFPQNSNADCGDLRTNGQYAEYVLEALPE